VVFGGFWWFLVVFDKVFNSNNRLKVHIDINISTLSGLDVRLVAIELTIDAD
jgi:hypothetical protein